MLSPRLDTTLILSTIQTKTNASNVSRSRGPGKRLFLRFLLCSSLILSVLVSISFLTSTSAHRGNAELMPKAPSGSPALSPAAPLAVETIDTRASDCATPKVSYLIGETVCARSTGAPLPFFGIRQRRFQWVAPDNTVARLVDITTDPQLDSLTIPLAGPFAQVGTWTLRTIKNNGSVATLTRFVVRDPVNLRTNLAVIKTGPLGVKSGGNAIFEVTVTNRGPDDAQNVVLTDDVPLNMTFFSDTQAPGPAFTCTDPTVGSSGTTTCTGAMLAVGESATFTLTYKVDSGIPYGPPLIETTVIENTVNVSSNTVELFPIDNSATTRSAVTGPFVEDSIDPTISCTSDLTVPEDTPGSGSAIVNYSAPIASDNSGSVVVNCVPAAGSNFPVGVTMVTCVASDPSGNEASCSFFVTVTPTGSCSLTCPANVVVDLSASDSACGAVVNYNPPVATGCGTVTSTPASGSFFPVGTTTVTVTTGAGASCDFSVTVRDHRPPVVATPLPTATVVADNNCLATVPDLITNLVISDCTEREDLTITQNPAAGQTVSGAGVHTVTIIVTDSSNNSTTVNPAYTVVDETRPVITLNGANPITVECHTSFTDPGATATDNCASSFPATASGIVNVNTPGSYTITYNASDPSGNAATPVTRTVNVVDTTPPTITMTGTPIALWPPNHSYHTINLTQLVASASDGCDGGVDINDVVISKVTSDETENGGGDGNTFNDIVIATNCKSVQLRAERNGGGNGRVYTITFRVKDASGNSRTATAIVTVPKSQGNGGAAINDGPNYTVNGTCP